MALGVAARVWRWQRPAPLQALPGRKERRMHHQDRSRILVLIGVGLMLAGTGSALLGPVEMSTFYFFSEGGRFHYEGFGFGSLMFGNIATQIAGYYLIGLILIPLGYGHLKLRRWARTLAETLLWCWLVLGVPLTAVFLFILFSSKDLSAAAGILLVVVLFLSYPVVPLLMIRFYRGHNVRRTFEARDPKAYWTEGRPVPILVVAVLLVFYAIVLHIPILFNGLAPLYGQWLTGLEGIIALEVQIVCAVCLAWGVLRQKVWAWWGTLIFFGLLASSLVATLLASTYLEILSLMKFAPTEVEILEGVPLQGYHLAAFVGLPLLLTLAATILAQRHFRSSGRTADQSP
jgi:hypothetical protein